MKPPCPRQTRDSYPPLSPNTDSRSGLLLHFGASCQGSKQSVNDRSVRLIVKGQNMPASQRSQWARDDTPLFSSENHHFGYADAQIMNTYSSSGECTHVTTCHSTGVRKRARAAGCVLPPRLPPLHAKCGIGSQATVAPTRRNLWSWDLPLSQGKLERCQAWPARCLQCLLY